jgi:signal transduction histidine kinase
MAREVHDELGQVLTALRMNISLAVIHHGAHTPDLQDALKGMKVLVDRAIQGVRNVSANLRPSALDMGLVAAVEWLCHEFVRHNALRCEFLADETLVELDDPHCVVIFRIVQESLTNIARYANASHVWVSIGHNGNELGVEVRDDGCGFDVAAAAQKKTFGLLGMRERALALGGRLDVISRAGQGTVVGLSIPLAMHAVVQGAL